MINRWSFHFDVIWFPMFSIPFQALLEGNATVEWQDIFGATPLHLAAAEVKLGPSLEASQFGVGRKSIQKHQSHQVVSAMPNFDMNLWIMMICCHCWWMLMLQPFITLSCSAREGLAPLRPCWHPGQRRRIFVIERFDAFGNHIWTYLDSKLSMFRCLLIQWTYSKHTSDDVTTCFRSDTSALVHH